MSAKRSGRRSSPISPAWRRRELARLVTGPVTPVIEDAGLAAKAAALLPPEPWDEDTWGAWTKAVAAETGAKGRALFHPLRLALTGPEHGPELKKLLPLIGRDQGSGAAGRKNRVTQSFRHYPDFDLRLSAAKTLLLAPKSANFHTVRSEPIR